MTTPATPSAPNTPATSTTSSTSSTYAVPADGFIRDNFPRPYLHPGGTPTEGEQKNMDTIVRVMQEFWCSASREVAKELFAAGSLRHDPLVPDILGPDAYADMVAEYHQSWRMNEFVLHIVMAEKDWIAWRVLTKCTHIADFYGVPATGIDLDVLTHTFVIHDKDHKALEGWILTDYAHTVKEMLIALPWWKKLLYAPRMYKTLHKKYYDMLNSGHRPKARAGHEDLQIGPDGYMRDNFPAPWLEAERPTPEEIKHVGVVIRANKEFWFQGKTEIVREIFAEGGLRHETIIPDTGLDGYAELVNIFHKAFKFKEFDIQVVMAEGDFVAFRTVTNGVHVGEFYGLPPTGAEITVVTHAFTRFNKDDLIIEAWAVTDYLGLLLDLFFAMSWWQRIVAFPKFYRNLKEHLGILHSTKNKSYHSKGLPPPEPANT